MSTDTDDVIARLRAFSGEGWKLGDDLAARIATLEAENARMRAEVAALRGRVAELAEGAFVAWYDAACSEDYGARARLISDAQAAESKVLAALRGPAAVKGATTDGE